MQNFKVLYTKVRLIQLFHFSYGMNFGAEVLTVAPLDKSIRAVEDLSNVTMETNDVTSDSHWSNIGQSTTLRVIVSVLKFHGSPKYTSIKYRKTWKFRRAFFKPVSFHRSPWKPRVWHARFKVSVRYNCGIIMFPHGSEPRGRRVWRRSATYDRTRPPHIESQGGLCGYSRFSVRFLLASQPDRSQGEPREWKWMENWWTNNNRCPGERVETLTRGKFITGACLASTFVCRPGTCVA